ncbi:MAG: PDZ domain-containing protein [Clostridia bacterium]|nr:PDZ domain-containing protein [Clostridia bacterium]
MIGFIISAIKIIFLLGFLIFIHELGHFTVAKWCKVRVNEFAIGFGPTIWRRQGKETKYALRLVPLGGFVSMEGEEQRSEATGSFSKASIPKRIAIVVAGAMVNILFALMVYFLLAASSGSYITNEVNTVIEGYPAQEIGIQAGDKILQINKEKIHHIYDLNKALQRNTEEIKIKIERKR